MALFGKDGGVPETNFKHSAALKTNTSFPINSTVVTGAAETEIILFFIAGTELCFGLSMRIMFKTQKFFSCC